MKTLQILLLLVLILSSCTNKKENVTIKGKFINKENKELLCTPILTDAFDSWFKDSVVVDSSGSFIISLQLDEPRFIDLLTNSSYKQLIIEPGETYEIEIRGEQGQIELMKKSDTQLFYDDLSNSHPLVYEFFPNDVSNYDSICRSLNEKLDKELLELRKLNCSENVRSIISRDRQVYYNLAISSLALRNKIISIQNNVATPNDVMNMWGTAVSDTFLTNPMSKKTTYYYDLLRMAFEYDFNTKLDSDSIKVIRKEKRVQGLILSHDIELAKSFLPKEILEFYSATYIQSSAFQNNFEKELINLFVQFKTDYPNSKYISYIQTSIDEISDFYLKVEDAFNEEYKFVDNYKNINSFSDCILPFKGKKLYVDIWTTSCGACKKEFEFNEKLKKVLKNKGVEVLYISLDRDKNEDRWQDMIKYYNLTGNHIRANKNLKSDLDEKLRIDWIPRYLIIDEQGKIINDNAPWPSNLIELEKQL